MIRKVLLLFYGTVFPEEEIAYAIHLNQQHPVLLTGLFFREADMIVQNLIYPEPGQFPLAASKTELLEQQASIERFERLCTDNGIAFSIQKDTDQAAEESIKQETRFADLLLVGSSSFYEKPEEKIANPFLKGILHISECPIIIIPRHFNFPGNILLAYDGSADSVYAIKLFAYLFPYYSNHKTTLVYAGKNEKEPVPAYAHIESFAGRHFSDLSIRQPDLKEETLAQWLQEQEPDLLVTGSAGRSYISELFKRSFSRDIIREHKRTVFMAHR